MIGEAIIHVGMHKTGSSSIQETFSKLTNGNARYLDLGPPNHSGILITSFSSDAGRYHAHVANGRTADDVSRLRQTYLRRLESRLSRASGDKVIISGEGLSGPQTMDKGALLAFRQKLLQYCKSIRVIGYVRPPISYMQSAFQQRLKAGTSRRWEPKALYPRYHDRFHKLDEVFGADAVELGLFDPKSLYQNDVVSDFGQRVGIEVPKTDIVRVNESLSLEATALLYVARRFASFAPYSGFSRDERQLVAALAGVGDKKLAFAPAMVGAVLEGHRADIEWMSQRLGRRILDEPYPSDRPIASEQDLLAVACEQRQVLWELLEHHASGTDSLVKVSELITRLHSLTWAEAEHMPWGRAGIATKAPESSDFADGVLDPAEILCRSAAALERSDPDVASALKQVAEKAARAPIRLS